MGVFDAEKVEVFFPVRTFFSEWRDAKTGFHPVGGAVVCEARLLHVVDIFVASDGALAECAVADGAKERGVLAESDAGFDEVTHIVRRNIAESDGVATGVRVPRVLQ